MKVIFLDHKAQEKLQFSALPGVLSLDTREKRPPTPCSALPLFGKLERAMRSSLLFSKLDKPKVLSSSQDVHFSPFLSCSWCLLLDALKDCTEGFPYSQTVGPRTAHSAQGEAAPSSTEGKKRKKEKKMDAAGVGLENSCPNCGKLCCEKF